jgi:16S rRNA (guanine527-N7)-methyltransferase
MNLSAIHDPDAVWTQHVADCLAVVPVLSGLKEARHALRLAEPGAWGAPQPFTVLDAGTGAGLPALVLSLWLPDSPVFAVDKVAKKLAFVRQVAAQLRLRHLQTCHARLEDLRLPGMRGKPDMAQTPPTTQPPILAAEGVDVVISRAFSSLRDLVDCTAHLIHPRGVWLAMKGRYPYAEITALAQTQPWVQVQVDVIKVPGLDQERCVVQMWRDARTVGDRHHHGRHHHKCDHPEWTEGQREDAARAGVG